MNKQTQRKIIQINHALSGVYGNEIKQKANRISDVRKQILRRLQRKKKHSSILHDQLYQYLQKFPEEKSNLQTEVLKTKKNNYFQNEEKQLYQIPVLYYPTQQKTLLAEEKKDLEKIMSFLNTSGFNIENIIQKN